MPPTPRTRHRGACINCRQQKVKSLLFLFTIGDASDNGEQARCDAFERLPTPCSRCEKAGKECIIDRSFRRSTRRDRLDELEQELRDLRQNLHQPSAAAVSNGDENHREPEVSSGTPADRSATFDADEPAAVELNGPSLVMSGASTPLLVQQLEDTVLQPSETMEHIVIFYRYYHENLPILPSMTILLRHVQSCQLLLWAIVVTTSPHIESRRHLQVHLVDAIRRLVATEFLVSEATSILQIQALILLSYWPMPFKATIQDPSWIYSNMALSKALRIGLHRSSSFFQFMYGAQGGEKMRLRTWVACWIMAQLYAAGLGLPATVRTDNIILKCVAERPPDLPVILHRMLVITHKIHIFTEQLGDHHFTTDGLLPEPLALVQAFDSDIRSLESVCDTDKVMILMARLYLYSFILAAPPTSKGQENKLAPVQTHDGVYYISQTYNCAKAVIEMFMRRSKSGTRDGALSGAQHPRLWNGFERWSVMYATMTILWIIKLSGIDSNTASAQTLVNEGRDILRKLILTNEDHYTRVYDVINFISSMDPSSAEGRNMSRNVVRARMSVNIIWDVVYAAKQRYNERQMAARTADEYFHVATPMSGDDPASAVTEQAMYGNDYGTFDALFTDWDALMPDFDLIDPVNHSPQPHW